MSALYTFPNLREISPKGVAPSPVKQWELMLLLEEFGPESVVLTLNKVADQLSGGQWEAVAKDHIEAVLFGDVPPQTSLPLPEIHPWMRKTMERIRGARARRERVLPKVRYRDLFLNALAGMEDYTPRSTTNWLHHDVGCPACRKPLASEIRLRYGPCDGYTYRVGDSIDWTRPGHIPDVRDRELHYVELTLPACDACSYQGMGVVTVERDAVGDVFVWPKAALEGLNPYRAKGFELSNLDAFLYAREFTPELFAEVLSTRPAPRVGVVPMPPGPRGLLEELADRAHREIGWHGFE